MSFKSRERTVLLGMWFLFVIGGEYELSELGPRKAIVRDLAISRDLGKALGGPIHSLLFRLLRRSPVPL